MTRAALLVLAAAFVSCDEPKKPVDQSAVLGGGIAARVGSEVVPAELVAKIAAEQKIPVADALHRAVDDAIAAESAKARGLDRTVPASWLLVSARARLAADRLVVDATARGAPTDEEVRRLSKIHWREVDRPPSMKVVQVVVKRPGDKAKTDAAKALAAKIRDAVAAAPIESFRSVAEAVPHDKELEVHVDDVVGPFIEDGQITSGSGGVVPEFAKAAFTLANPGDTSGVVETEAFGWHVIRLLERLPEMRIPFEIRRSAFTDEVIATRAHDALVERLDALRASVPIVIAPNAEQLMRGVRASTP